MMSCVVVFDGRVYFFMTTHTGVVLNLPCILNMKCLVTLKYKQRKISKTSSESNLEVCRQYHGIAKTKKKHYSAKSRITKWTEFQENEVGTK